MLAMEALPRYADGWLNSENPLDSVSEAEMDEIEAIIDNAIYDVMTPVEVSMREIGEIAMYGSTTLPAGWLECVGTAISRSTYSDLFDVIGETFGAGDGSTTFNIPDFRAAFPQGRDPIVAPGSESAIGGTGGEASHILTTAEIPAHQHAQRVQPTTGASTNRLIAQSASGATQDSALPTGSTGGGEAHENRPPFQTVVMMIYTGVV